jgi:hypothetical protein
MSLARVAPHFPPTFEDLKAKALEFIKQCKPTEYQRLRNSGELLGYCELKANAASDYAAILIASGIFEKQAWHMAIRSQILESESD